MSGEQIRELRVRLGMTQLDFANELGTTPTTISRWESGRIKPQRIYQRELLKLAAGQDSESST